VILYFARMEPKRNLQMALDVGVTHVLVSAHKLMREPGTLEFIESVKDRLSFFCDSGAFTVMEKYGVYGKKAEGLDREPGVQEYFLKLCEFYRQYGYLFEVLAEFDVGDYEAKTRFRKQLEDAGGRQTLPTWAGGVDPRSYADWLAQEYDYIGIGGFSGEVGVSGVQVMRKSLGYLRKFNVRCHGWGTTGSEILKKVPLYSADSTTWISGSQYGVTFQFKGGRLFQWGKEEKRRRQQLRRHFQEAPAELKLDFDAFLADQGDAVDRWNLYQWHLYAQYVDSRQQKPYWECTCGSEETQGACKVHGVGKSGNPPPIREGDHHTEETRRQMSLSAMGNLNALVHGKRTSRVPQVQCDTCYLSDRCKGYEEGAVCRYDPDFQEAAAVLGSRNWEAVVSLHVTKMQIDWARYARGAFYEAADGGLIDKSVSALSAQLSNDEKLLARLLGVLQPEGLKVDARKMQIIVQNLSQSEGAVEQILDAVGMIREVAPQLLDGPGEE